MLKPLILYLIAMIALQAPAVGLENDLISVPTRSIDSGEGFQTASQTASQTAFVTASATANVTASATADIIASATESSDEPNPGRKRKLSLNGQAVIWSTLSFQNPFVLQPGGRFVPTLLGDFSMGKHSRFDFEASLNINGTLTFTNNQVIDSTFALKPYRIWLRYSNDHSEVRLGLQKINFGSAKMFRPLMWFDGLDVRDPLQLTNGVYGALGKYFFENNANIWAWALVGNHEPKGFEVWGSQTWLPEIGGRFEIPLGPGEIGLAMHSRQIDLNVPTLNPYWQSLGLDPVTLGKNRMQEGRLGFNGKWDLGVGVWVEGSLNFVEENPYVPSQTDMLNAGLDYTIPVGSGLGLTLEYFRYHSLSSDYLPGNDMHLLGLMANYPLSITDQISCMIFALPSGNQIFNYISWSRSLDNWSIFAFAYWNPENVRLMMARQNAGSNLFSGKGMQFMVSYNF